MRERPRNAPAHQVIGVLGTHTCTGTYHTVQIPGRLGQDALDMIRALLLLRPATATAQRGCAYSKLKPSGKLSPTPKLWGRFIERLVNPPKHKMRPREFWSYLALGIGTLGVGYMGFNTYQ